MKTAAPACHGKGGVLSYKRILCYSKMGKVWVKTATSFPNPVALQRSFSLAASSSGRNRPLTT